MVSQILQKLLNELSEETTLSISLAISFMLQKQKKKLSKKSQDSLMPQMYKNTKDPILTFFMEDKRTKSLIYLSISLMKTEIHPKYNSGTKVVCIC